MKRGLWSALRNSPPDHESRGRITGAMCAAARIRCASSLLLMSIRGREEAGVVIDGLLVGSYVVCSSCIEQPADAPVEEKDSREPIAVRVGGGGNGRGDVLPVCAVVGGKEQPIAGGDPSGAGGEQFEVLDWQRNDWHFGELLRGELPGCGASRRGGLRVNDNPLCPSGEASRQGERGNREKIPGEIRGQLLSAEIIGCRIELVKLNSEYRGAYPTLRRQPGSGFSNPKAAKNSGPSFAWNYLPLAQNVHRFKRQRGLAMVKAGIKSSGNQKAPALCVPICQECPRSVPPTKGTPPPPYLL